MPASVSIPSRLGTLGKRARLMSQALLCLAFVLLTVARSHAQSDGTALAAVSSGAGPVVVSRSVPLTLDRIVWGWTGDSIRPELHNPVAITISSGTRAVAGLASLTYPQDGSQNATIVTAFSTTPNVPTTVMLAACPSRGTSEMRLEIVADGRQFRFPIISPVAVGPRDIARPRELDSPVWLALASDITLPSLTPTEPQRPAGMPVSRAYWNVASVLQLPAERFSDAWIHYESAEGVIVRQSDLVRLAPAKRDALRMWLDNGGRVVVVLDQAGDEWRLLFPPFMDSDMLDVSPSTRVTPGADTREMLTREQVRPAEWTPSSASDEPWSPISARLISPGPGARALGWQAFWEPESRAGAGIGACGPVGMGVLMLVGVDPAMLPRTMNARQSAAAWRDALDRARDGRYQDQMEVAPMWGYSGVDNVQQVAVSRSADAVLQGSAPGTAFFLVVMLAVLAMGVWIGPAGRRVLRSRGRLSSSWLVALGSVGICTVFGLAAPRVFRSGTHGHGTLTLHDVFVDERGVPMRVYTTTLIATSSGRPTTMDLAGEDTGQTGQWWRGVSPIQRWWDVPLLGGSSLVVFNTPAQRGTPAAGVLEPVNFGQWTHRVTVAITPGQAPTGSSDMPRVRVVRDETDSDASAWREPLRVEIEAGETSNLQSLGMVIFRGWRGASTLATTGAGTTMVVEPGQAVQSPLITAMAQQPWQATQEPHVPYPELSFMDMSLLRPRGETVQRLTDSGDYAAVILMATSSGADEDSRWTRRTLYRIIAPVATGATLEPRSAPDENTLPENLP